jgi:predicted Zn-dependent peptidase
MSADTEPSRDGVVIAERPIPGTPRPYEFPVVVEDALANGLRILVANLPGRPLVSASLVLRTGAVDEPPDEAGATVLAARALSEGTERFTALELIEASERLGASLHAEAGWDAFSAGVDVPSGRLPEALDLLAELMLRPTFPAAEVDRIRDERLNDILQAKAEPRRRVEETLVNTIYQPIAPYHRPAAGTHDTVERLTPEVLRRAWSRGLDPSQATLIVGGDLTGHDVPAIAERLFGSWAPSAGAVAAGSVVDTGSTMGRLVRVVHRPGSVQTEIRIGHRGSPRRIPDFHALSVMGAILGGLFNSRLNMKLREEKGYTYGAGAGFEMRRGAGPFAARAAVNTEVTVPAILDTIAELTRIRDEAVTPVELAAARDFLIGVFPLRFETAGAVVGAIGGLVVHGLPVEELVTYRSRIEAVDAAAVLAAAREHIDVEGAAIVLVGDVDAFGSELEAAGLGRIIIEPDDVSAADAPPPAAAALDEDSDAGPTAGAEEPDQPGTADEPVPGGTTSEDVAD